MDNFYKIQDSSQNREQEASMGLFTMGPRGPLIYASKTTRSSTVVKLCRLDGLLRC